MNVRFSLPSTRLRSVCFAGLALVALLTGLTHVHAASPDSLDSLEIPASCECIAAHQVGVVATSLGGDLLPPEIPEGRLREAVALVTDTANDSVPPARGPPRP